jgi:hypothetical protein
MARLATLNQSFSAACHQSSLPFDPADPRKAALAELPHTAAVFALYGAEAHAEPYIGRTPNLKARLERLLQPSAKHPRRLQLAGRVRRIAWRLTGSDFESLLAQFSLLEEVYGAKCAGADAPGRAGFHTLPGEQCLSAHRGDQPAKPAGSRLGLWAVPVAGRGRALCR